MSFSKNLRELRELAGLSRKDLAEHLHMHPNAYAMYETGRREPSLEKLVTIAQFLGVTTDALLGYTLPSFEQAKSIIEDCELMIVTDEKNRVGITDNLTHALKWYDTPDEFTKEILEVHNDYQKSSLRIESEQSFILANVLNPFLQEKRTPFWECRE